MVSTRGGFPHDPQRRAELAPTLDTLLPLPPPGCNGDGLRLGESAGGRVADDLRSPIAWAPVSRVPHRDGETGHFPHIIERVQARGDRRAGQRQALRQ
ncbi:FAD-binding protein [Pseudomonas aeruginosa]